MKTKKVSKDRKKIREFNIESELKGEFGDVFSDDFLDEETMILTMAEDEE